MPQFIKKKNIKSTFSRPVVKQYNQISKMDKNLKSRFILLTCGVQTTSSYITAQPVNTKPQISNGPTQVEEDLVVETCFCNYRITRIAKEQTAFIQADSAFNNRTKSSKKTS